METIEIAMAVDAKYVRQLAVALVSISEQVDDPCRVHVLHDGVSLADRERMQGKVSDRIDVAWIDARPAVDGRRLPRGIPRSIYFRLYLAQLLPRDLERVIFLDADVIVRRSLRALWCASLGDAPIGAVRDAYLPWVARNRRFDWRGVDVSPDAPFFNSGVMVVDLRRWRDDGIGARALALLSEESRMFDQRALNIVLAHNWAVLDPRWNVQSYHLTGDTCLAFVSEGRERLDEALRDPAIVHFTGGSFNRPWQAPCRNPYRDEWLAYLDRTAWRGWRPDPEPALVRAWGRATRAFHVLRYGGVGDRRGLARDAGARANQPADD
jgi:lipopolysaccharide biosynthesis glycosyltransferase